LTLVKNAKKKNPCAPKRHTGAKFFYQKVVNKVGGATAMRAEQAEQLRAHILSSPHPVIVCGDFNDTPNSYTYHHIAAGLTDAFEEKGFGLGTTFGGALPMLRIDYLLTDPGIRVHDCRVVRDTEWSDHYPVWGVFGVVGKE
jgi:endonuclease/exonuclease/phosphatase family metal-dependent hydrolase